MTETDVRVVAENAHFIHFLYDLLRMIEDGTPVTSYVQMGLTDNNTAKIEKRIAEELQRLTRRYKEKVKCTFKIGDVIECVCGIGERGKIFTILNFITVLDNQKTYNAVLLANGDETVAIPTEIINSNYILYEKD